MPSPGAPPTRLHVARTWYHGSPHRLTVLATESTVTPVIELAKAFSHKPSQVQTTVHENDATGVRRVVIRHNGTRLGYLYQVRVDNPDADLRQHPRSVCFAGEEMLTTRPLPLEFLQELPLDSSYVQEIVERYDGDGNRRG